MSQSSKEAAAAPPPFATQRPEARSRMLSVRVTPSQDAFINAEAARLGVDRAELVRRALDHFIASVRKGDKG